MKKDYESGSLYKLVSIPKYDRLFIYDSPNLAYASYHKDIFIYHGEIFLLLKKVESLFYEHIHKCLFKSCVGYILLFDDVILEKL